MMSSMIAWTPVLAILVVAFVAAQFLLPRRRGKGPNGSLPLPPGPKGAFLIGNLLQM